MLFMQPNTGIYVIFERNLICIITKHLYMKNKSIFFTLFLGLCNLTLMAQNREVTITVDTLSTQIYMLTGQGGNIGIYVGKDKVFMIDDQFAPLSDKIKTSIESLTDKPIGFLFNTHMHGDHSGGNANFNTKNTTIVAHDNVRNRIKTNQLKRIADQKTTPEIAEQMLPELTFSDDITFFDGDETIMAIHVHNAHTDGDAIIYFLSNNVLHMGDTYFSKRYPFIDLNSGGSIDGFIAAQKKAILLINDDTKVMPGHGRPSNKAEMVAALKVLEAIRQRVKEQITAGKTLEEVVADTSLTADYDATYGIGFIKPDRMRETVYKSLQGE